MGVIEQKVKKNIRKSKINSAIIGTLAVAGGLTMALLAPNLATVLGKALQASDRQGMKRSLGRLISHGYIEFRIEHGKKRLRLTQKGEKYAALMGEGKLAPKKPKRWDHKWRILIFDIPEKRRKIRDGIRSTLMNLGFHRLQDSVWVYPYDCEDFITILKAEFRIGKDVLYLVADAVEYDDPLKSHFGLA
jgi:DNA-binding transcriptional regulator PaaX